MINYQFTKKCGCGFDLNGKTGEKMSHNYLGKKLVLWVSCPQCRTTGITSDFKVVAQSNPSDQAPTKKVS